MLEELDCPFEARSCVLRLALLGDAAHPMKPNIGQGAAQALEDAVVLASCVAGHADPEDAFAPTNAGACGARTRSSAPPAGPAVQPRSARRSAHARAMP